MFNLIDTHIHLDAPELHGCGMQLLPMARQTGIKSVVIPGVRVSGWTGMVALAESHPGVYAAPGLHPVYVEQWNDVAAEELCRLAAKEQVVAIGEIGLDGVKGPDLRLQEKALRAQLDIAIEARLPVLLHARKTAGRLLDILLEYKVGERCGAVWHGFSGSVQFAERLIAHGFLLGIGPILLRENARKLVETVVALPLSALVLETDLPDMASQPQVLRHVASRIAEVKALDLAEVAAVTTANSEELFHIL